MRIVRAVLHLGKSRMDVVVDLGDELVKVGYQWVSKEQTDVPPARWPLLIQKEIELLKQSRRKEQALNRFLSGRKPR